MAIPTYQTKRVEEVVGGISHKELTLTLSSPLAARCVLAQATGNVYQDGNEFWASGSTKGKLRGDSITVSAVRNEDALAEAEWTFQKFQELADQVEEQLRSGVLAVLVSDLLEMKQELDKAGGKFHEVRYSIGEVEDKVRQLTMLADSLDRRADYLEREAEKAAADFSARLETADAEIGVLREENHALKLLAAQLEERVNQLTERADALDKDVFNVMAALEAQRRDRWYLRLWRWLTRRDS